MYVRMYWDKQTREKISMYFPILWEIWYSPRFGANEGHSYATSTHSRRSRLSDRLGSKMSFHLSISASPVGRFAGRRSNRDRLSVGLLTTLKSGIGEANITNHVPRALIEAQVFKPLPIAVSDHTTKQVYLAYLIIPKTIVPNPRGT